MNENLPQVCSTTTGHVEADRLFKLFDEMQFAAILINTASGSIVDVNQSACRVLRYQRSELTGKPFTELQSDISDSPGRFVTQDSQILRFDVHEMQLQGASADTQLVILKPELRSSHDSERLQLALESARFGVWEILLPERQLIWDSVCGQIFGLMPAEYPRTRRAFLTLVHPDDREEVEEAARRTLERGDDYAKEFRIIRSDGQIRWHAAFGRRLCDSNGLPISIIGVCTDCTAAKALQQQSMQSQKMESLGRMASGISHEFNNLMTVVCGYADIILKTAQRDADIREAAKRIRQSAIDASELTSKLLAFSRQEPVRKEAIDLVGVGERIQIVLRRLLHRRHSISFVASCPSATCQIDRLQIKQVIMNLVLNARDAMPDGGEIRICVEVVNLTATDTILPKSAKAGRYVKVSVIDSGIGIPEELLPRIFDPFFTTKETGKGTGLGLSIVHGIVQENGGFICLSSASGRGSCFEVCLPSTELNVYGAQHHVDLKFM
ncbi:MAG: ATP-binding protein [Planctomycetaceae bacterium]